MGTPDPLPRPGTPNYFAFGIECLGVEFAKPDNAANPRVEEAERHGLPEAPLEISVDLSDDRVDLMPLLTPRSVKIQTYSGDVRRNSAPYRRGTRRPWSHGLNIQVTGKGTGFSLAQ